MPMPGPAEPDPPTFALDEVLGYLLGRVAHVLEHGFTDLMAAEGLTVRQFGILNHVARDPGIGSAEIARRLEITPQSMGDQVETLRRHGLLVRDPDPGPGRKIGVHLTEEGAAVLSRARRLAAAYERHTTGHLSAAERTRLAGDLREILRRARERPDAGA